MACCLTAPSHYPNQCWLVIGKVFSIQLKVISQDMFNISTIDMCFITNLKLQLHLPGTNEFKLRIEREILPGAKASHREVVQHIREVYPTLIFKKSSKCHVDNDLV